MAATAVSSPLPKRLVRIAAEGVQKILDDPFASYFDLPRHGHPGKKRNLFPLDNVMVARGLQQRLIDQVPLLVRFSCTLR